MLTNPLLNQETNLVSRYSTYYNSVLMLSSTKPKNGILVDTRSKDYGNLNPSKSQPTNQPIGSTTSLSTLLQMSYFLN